MKVINNSLTDRNKELELNVSTLKQEKLSKIQVIIILYMIILFFLSHALYD